MGLDPFNGTALKLLFSAISLSVPKWVKWGVTLQHHSFIQQTEQRMEITVRWRGRHVIRNFTGSSTAVRVPVTVSSKLINRWKHSCLSLSYLIPLMKISMLIKHKYLILTTLIRLRACSYVERLNMEDKIASIRALGVR